MRTYGDFEVREYSPCVIAEVKVTAEYSSATSRAFSHLFRYISQGNSSQQKIAMTAPVIASQKDQQRSNEWFVSFVMPSGSTMGFMPAPNDPEVILREIDTQICIATSFRGKATREKSAQVIEQLRKAAAKENIALSDETRICRFDPPFKPGFLQYNEIVIPAYL
jgi:hypothetical protein